MQFTDTNSRSACGAGPVATSHPSLGQHHHQRRRARRDRNTPVAAEIHRCDPGSLLTRQHRRLCRTGSRLLGDRANIQTDRCARRRDGVGKPARQAVERQRHHDARGSVRGARRAP